MNTCLKDDSETKLYPPKRHKRTRLPLGLKRELLLSWFTRDCFWSSGKLWKIPLRFISILKANFFTNRPEWIFIFQIPSEFFKNWIPNLKNRLFFPLRMPKQFRISVSQEHTVHVPVEQGLQKVHRSVVSIDTLFEMECILKIWKINHISPKSSKRHIYTSSDHAKKFTNVMVYKVFGTWWHLLSRSWHLYTIKR